MSFTSKKSDVTKGANSSLHTRLCNYWITIPDKVNNTLKRWENFQWGINKDIIKERCKEGQDVESTFHNYNGPIMKGVGLKSDKEIIWLTSQWKGKSSIYSSCFT